MNVKGFTIIELLIAMAVAAILASALFAAFFQLNRSVNSTDSIMGNIQKAEQFEEIFERDLSGATLLLDNEKAKKEQTPETSPTTTGTGQAQQQPKKAEPKKAEPEKEAPEKPIIKNIFVSTNKADQLDTLSFISNNRIATFTAVGKTAVAKPLLVRITYQLKENPNQPGSFMLMRQESNELDMQKRSGRSYELLGGIKKLSLQFTSKIVKTTKKPAPESDKSSGKGQKDQKEPKKPQEPEQAGKQKTEISFKEGLNTWDSNELLQESQKTEKKQEESEEKTMPIPAFVKAELVLWDNQQQRESTYTINSAIVTDTYFTPKKRWSFMKFFEEMVPTDTNQQGSPTQPQKPGMPGIPGSPGKTAWRANFQGQHQGVPTNPGQTSWVPNTPGYNTGMPGIPAQTNVPTGNVPYFNFPGQRS